MRVIILVLQIHINLNFLTFSIFFPLKISMYSHGVLVKMFLAARNRMTAKCSLKARHLIVSHNENLAINNPSLVQQLQNINNDPGAL